MFCILLKIFLHKNSVKNIFWQKQCRVAEWLALQTGMRGDSSSIPAEVKPFFEGNKSPFELNLNF